MNIEIGQKVLVTTDNWFYGSDGRQYKAAWGTVRGVFSDQDALGIKTNARSTNWYAQIGSLVIAGCQIHYAVQCDNPDLGEVRDWSVRDGRIEEYFRPSAVFNADGDSQ